MRCVIAGGGVAGLSLAHSLLEQGVEPLVLEASDRVGGKLRSDRHGPYLVEWGPGSFTDSDAAVRRLLDALGLEPRRLPAAPEARQRWVLADGRLQPVPASPGSLLASRLFGPVAKARVLADLLLPRGPSARGLEESVEHFAQRRLGRRGAERLLYPLVSALYAASPAQVSVRSAFPWLAAVEREHRSVLLGIPTTVLSPQRTLASFVDGMEELPRALAARRGPRVRTGVRVERVVAGAGGFEVAVREGDRGARLSAEAVVLATPADVTASVVEPCAGFLSPVLRSIPYVPVALAYLGYAAAGLRTPPRGYGFLAAPGEPTGILGGVFHSCLFPGRAPDGHVLLAARLGGSGAAGKGVPQVAEAARLAGETFAALFGAAEPSFVEVVRHERALPQYTLGHAEKVAAVDAAEARVPGLYFAGNPYRGAGVHDLVRDGERLAARIARALASPRAAG